MTFFSYKKRPKIVKQSASYDDDEVRVSDVGEVFNLQVILDVGGCCSCNRMLTSSTVHETRRAHDSEYSRIDGVATIA